MLQVPMLWYGLILPPSIARPRPSSLSIASCISANSTGRRRRHYGLGVLENGDGHGPGDPILVRVAFANEPHARRAFATMEGSRDLFDSVELSECDLLYCDLILLDVRTRHANRARVVTLAQGLHGVVVRIGDRLLAPCIPKPGGPMVAEDGDS